MRPKCCNIHRPRPAKIQSFWPQTAKTQNSETAATSRAQQARMIASEKTIIVKHAKCNDVCPHPARKQKSLTATGQNTTFSTADGQKTKL